MISAILQKNLSLHKRRDHFSKINQNSNQNFGQRNKKVQPSSLIEILICIFQQIVGLNYETTPSKPNIWVSLFHAQPQIKRQDHFQVCSRVRKWSDPSWSQILTASKGSKSYLKLQEVTHWQISSHWHCLSSNTNCSSAFVELVQPGINA